MLAVLLANATLFRHNAVLFTLPLVFALFFYLERKKWLELILVFFAFLFLVKVPVYQALGVESADRRRQEIAGVPLTVIGNVVKEHPEVLDEETANFAYRMASQEEWEEQYICGNFNTIKWGSIDLSVIEETSIVDILKMTARCFRVAPRASCKALFTLTDIAYSTESAIEGAIIPWTADNEYGIDFHGNETIKSLLTRYEKVMTHILFEHIGTSILLMLMFILGRSDLKKWRDWKRILLCLPVFLYNFGTMLLLTGDDSRFFYISFLVCPLIVLMMMKDELTGEKQL